MKTIELKHIATIKNNTYRVALGNGTSHEFANMRKAQTFLSQTNRYLTDILHDIHRIHTSVIVLYQENWFYFKHNKKSMSSEMYSDDRLCQVKLEHIAKAKDLAINRASLTNGNYFVFVHMNNAFKLLKDIVLIMRKLSNKRSAAQQLHSCDSLFREILRIETDLNTWNQHKAAHLFEMPKEYELSQTVEFIPQLKVA